MTTSPNDAAAILRAGLASDASIYPQKLDVVRASVLLLRISEGEYRAASFLDDRILRASMQHAWVDLDEVAQAARNVAAPRPLHLILHMGHVGSTLLSRLLDETGSVLSLREPLPLRALADAYDVLGHDESLLAGPQFELLVETFVRLWSRGFAATHCNVVKATSTASRVAPALLRRRPEMRAIHLGVGAEVSLATLLAGANSWLDLRGHAAGRMRRLNTRLGRRLGAVHSLSTGELAAMSWLAEALTQRDLLEQFGNRVCAVDFDVFLGDVAGSMRRIVDHLGITVDSAQLARVATSSVLNQYSKAPEHAFGPAVRAQLLADARRTQRAEIARGLAWLDGVARHDATVAAVLQRAVS